MGPFQVAKMHVFEASKGWGIFEEIVTLKFLNLIENTHSLIQHVQ